MDVWQITVAAVRRWYVLVPLLGLTVALAYAAGQGVAEEYEVTGTAMVVPGRSYSDIPNPYGGPDDASNAVAIVLNSPEMRQRIADEGFIPVYQIAPSSRSTIMNFEVRGPSQQQAMDTGIAVFQMAAIELDQRQSAAGIRATEQYRLDVLQTPSVSAAVADGRLRNMAVVGVLGAALSLALAVFFDDVVGLVRRRRRTMKSAAESDDAPVSATDDEVDGEPAGDVAEPTAQPAPTPVAPALPGPSDEIVAASKTTSPRPAQRPKSRPRGKQRKPSRGRATMGSASGSSST